MEFSHIVPLIRAHLGVPWRIGEKEKAMEMDRLHEDEVLSLSWIRLTIDSIVRGLETSHVSASLAVGTPRYIVNTY